MEAEKHAKLAKAYRASIKRAEKIGKPWMDGTYRGPYGNAKDPKTGWHYSPRIRREAIKHELLAKKFRAAAKLIPAEGG